MAKYASDQAGSSCHVHLSLWNNDQNAFLAIKNWEKLSAQIPFAGFSEDGWLMYRKSCYFMPPTSTLINVINLGHRLPQKLPGVMTIALLVSA